MKLFSQFKHITCVDGVVICAPYEAYIAENKADFIETVFSYASADWHYNIRDKRCPHDAVFLSMMVEDEKPGVGGARQPKHLEIKWMGAFYDRIFKFSYNDVISYDIKLVNEGKSRVPHGWFYVDEIVQLPDGEYSHQILLDSDVMWKIVFRNFQFYSEMLPKS